jgi:hypothetical protein
MKIEEGGQYHNSQSMPGEIFAGIMQNFPPSIDSSLDPRNSQIKNSQFDTQGIESKYLGGSNVYGTMTKELDTK